MWRRLKEDRNQHYEDLSCPCWHDKRAMARFKEQPKHCSKYFCCGNPRRGLKGVERITMQERKFYAETIDARAVHSVEGRDKADDVAA